MLENPFLKFKKIVVLWILCVAFGTSGWSQTSTSSGSQEEINKQLLERIRELETQVKELKDKQSTTAPATEPAPAPVVETRRPNVIADRLKLQLFGDVGFQASNQKGTTNISHRLIRHVHDGEALRSRLGAGRAGRHIF